MEYHYTYRITNTKIRKYYYGARTCYDTQPREDIGVCYFSSSTDNAFIQDQKDNPQNYRYKVVKLFNTRKEAIDFEIKLHNKFNVKIHERFYNKANQTSVGFDNTGLVPAIDRITNKQILVTSDEYKNNNNLIRHTSNKVAAKDTVTGQTLMVEKNIFDSSSRYVGHDMGKVSAIDKRDGRIYKILKSVFDSHEHYVGVNSGKTGTLNSNAKAIILYNKEGIIIHTFNGNLISRCKEIKIAPALIIKSHKTGTSIKTTGKYKQWNGCFARAIKDEF